MGDKIEQYIKEIAHRENEECKKNRLKALLEQYNIDKNFVKLLDGYHNNGYETKLEMIHDTNGMNKHIVHIFPKVSVEYFEINMIISPLDGTADISVLETDANKHESSSLSGGTKF